MSWLAGLRLALLALGQLAMLIGAGVVVFALLTLLHFIQH